MANIKSQIKRNRQNEKRRLRNRGYRGAARSAVKNARTAMESGNETQASVLAAISTLDKAAQKGAIHPRNAARRKGRLMKQLAALGGGPLKSAKTEPAPAEGAAEKEGKEAKSKTAAKKPAAKKAAARKSTAKKKSTKS